MPTSPFHPSETNMMFPRTLLLCLLFQVTSKCRALSSAQDSNPEEVEFSMSVLNTTSGGASNTTSQPIVLTEIMDLFDTQLDNETRSYEPTVAPLVQSMKPNALNTAAPVFGPVYSPPTQTEMSTGAPRTITMSPSHSPTQFPSINPTLFITNSPTSEPSNTLIFSSIKNLSSIWNGLTDPLGEAAISSWERVTSNMITSYWTLAGENVVQNLQVATKIESYKANYARVRSLRCLQASTQQTIVYSHEVSYSLLTEDFSVSQIVLIPFSTPEKRLSYVKEMKATGLEEFSALQDVTAIEFVENSMPLQSLDGEGPNADQETAEVSGISRLVESTTFYIIVISASVGVVLITLIGTWCYCRRRKNLNLKSKEENRDAYMIGAYGPSASTANMST